MQFETPQPITLDARLSAGALTVTAEPRDTASVDIQPYDDSQASRDAAERTEVVMRGDTLVVHMPEGGWRLLAPGQDPGGGTGTRGHRATAQARLGRRPVLRPVRRRLQGGHRLR